MFGLDDCGYPEKVYSITLTSLVMNTAGINYNLDLFKCRPDTCGNCSVTYTISVYPGIIMLENEVCMFVNM